MSYYKDFREYIAALEAADLLRRVRTPICKDTELMPLVRLQFRGLPAEAGSYEWCQPAEADEATAADERFAMLNYAVDALKAKPNVRVYLDGTHSAWLGSGDAAHRLAQAGVDRADGFFLNASNYRLTEHLEKYGVAPSRAVLIGKRVNDVAAGKNAGVLAGVHLNGHGNREAMLKMGADFYVEHLTDIRSHFQ